MAHAAESVAIYWDLENLHANLVDQAHGQGVYLASDAQGCAIAPHVAAKAGAASEPPHFRLRPPDSAKMRSRCI